MSRVAVAGKAGSYGRRPAASQAWCDLACGVLAGGPRSWEKNQKKKPGIAGLFPCCGPGSLARGESQGTSGGDRGVARLEPPAAHRSERLAVEGARRTGTQ